MKRLIQTALLKWKDAGRRKPLIVRGARQVGKTFSVVQFGREHFESLAVVDLERNRAWHRVFDGDLDARQIIADLEVLVSQRIEPGKTLLFLDEIQTCPRALMALRYLYEECPDLHVIAAGSLLDFALKEVSFPVGRVQFMDMAPLSFVEYLWATGKEQAAEVVAAPPRQVSESIHEQLLQELRRYLFVGGMPESVATYVQSHSMQECFAVHDELCEAYRQDFVKYAPRADPFCLDSVLTNVARSVGRQIKYTRLADQYSHVTIKKAFHLLCKARVVKQVPAASPAGAPLGATASAKKFKALLVDVGVWQHLCGMKVDDEYRRADLLDIYEGAMAEQFVGQELALSQRGELHYWTREARGSSAEVDYLAVIDGAVFAVEVKRGRSGRLRSLHLLLDTHADCAGGLVFSCAPYAALPKQKLTFLPLYYAWSATGGRHEG